MSTKLIFKREVKPNVFVICTHRHPANEFQIQLQHADGIKYQSTNEPSRAVELIKQYLAEAL